MSVSLKVDYGPYEAFGVIAHRIQKARGLIKRLRELGYDIEVREVDLLNRLEIIMCCRKIFQCDIRNLRFNMDYDDDPVCAKAIDIVEEASNRMAMEINLSNFVSAKKGMKTSEMRWKDSMDQRLGEFEEDFEEVEQDVENEEFEEEEEEEEEDDKDMGEMSIKFRDAIKQETNRELERIETRRMEKALKEGMEEAKRKMYY